jgi:hypothetical protein
MGNPIDVATFLARARGRFGDRYDYSEIVYKSYKTPIKIRCTLHPVRLICITPERHLQTTGGCKYCLRVARNQQLERTLRLETSEPLHGEAIAEGVTTGQGRQRPGTPSP